MSRLLACYLLLSGLALLGPHRPSLWLPLLVVHVAVAALLLLRARGRGPARAGQARWREWLIDLAPLLVMPLLYSELPLLNQSLYDGHYFDEIVIGWERALFGFEPARAFARAAPWPWLSESLHAAYVSYYFIIYAPPLLIGWLRGRDALRDTVFTLSLVFFAHYLFFVWFPVEGPYYRFTGPGGAIAEQPVYRLTHAILDAGASRGAAFPSSHVGVSVAASVLCWRWLRPAAPFVTVLTLALALGTVYGGFHYAIDAILGGLFGLALALGAPALRRRLERVHQPAGAA